MAQLPSSSRPLRLLLLSERGIEGRPWSSLISSTGDELLACNFDEERRRKRMSIERRQRRSLLPSCSLCCTSPPPPPPRSGEQFSPSKSHDAKRNVVRVPQRSRDRFARDQPMGNAGAIDGAFFSKQKPPRPIASSDLDLVARTPSPRSLAPPPFSSHSPNLIILSI